MRIYDSRADDEAKTETMILGGEKRLEDMRLLVARYPASAIRDRDLNRAAIRQSRNDRDAALRSIDLAHGFDRVHQQVEDDLLQLHRIALYERQLGGTRHYANVSAHELAVQQRQGRTEEIDQINRFESGFTFLQQPPQAMDDLTGAVALRRDVVEDVPEFLGIEGVACEQPQARLSVG